MDKVILAYSGGLDTSVAIKWLREKYNLEVITLTADIGNVADPEAVRQKALSVGAAKAVVADARESFVNSFVFPALKANAVYEGQYPLATALGRPLIAQLLVETAGKENAAAVAHGCTAKGNDQVRLEVSITALAPELKMIAPAREWNMTREQTIEYAQSHDIPVPATTASPYSIDENLWGRSIECGVLEDPWTEAGDDVFAWTKSPQEAPDKADYITLGFDEGLPTSINGQQLNGAALIRQVHEIACKHGVGRIDHVETRVVGIKSREIYEAPAATVLIKAHQALEAITLSRDQLHFNNIVAEQYADLVYNGLWFSALRCDLARYVDASQRYVTGEVKVRLFKGGCQVAGRKSPYSLYDYSLATYDKGDAFDHSASPGFIHIWGLPLRTQSRAQHRKPNKSS